jgi:hypothetical protein
MAAGKITKTNAKTRSMKHPIITSLGLAVLAGVSLVNTASLSAVRTPFRTLCATLGFAALLAGVAQAQSSIGDYRSAGRGNWDTAATWESFNGTSWNAAATKPIATNSVYIQSAHTVTLTASAACMDIHFCAGSAAVSASTMGFVALGANTLAVHGKLRAYIAPVGTIPGTSTTTGFGKYPTTTNGAAGGKISIAGGSRTLTVSGEIGATVSTTTPGGDNAFPLEFNLDPGATVTLEATLKASCSPMTATR